MGRTFMNELLIKSRFSKSLKTYNENAKIQKYMARKLISFLDKTFYADIWEIGCGTGLLTQYCIENISFKSYTVNDIIPECKKYITDISPEIMFIAEDTDKFLKSSVEQFDLIISNGVFQWFENLSETVNKLTARLNPGGILLFTTFGKENFKEIYNVSGKTLLYYSKQELEKLFSKYSCSIEEEIQILQFHTPLDVLRHIKLTGVNSLESVTWTKSDIVKFSTKYLEYCESKPILTYNPIYVKIFKK